MTKIRILKAILQGIICFFLNATYAQQIKLVSLKSLASINNNSLANVRAIFQDKYKFAWIATQDGLMRFDGRSSIVYSKNANNQGQSLSNSDVDALLEDNDRTFIWTISSYGGIEKINLKTALVEKSIRFSSEKSQSQNYFFKGFEIDKDSLYTCTREGTFFAVNKITGQCNYKNINILQFGHAVEKFLFVNKKILLFLDSGVLLVFDKKDFSITQKIQLSYKKVYSLTRSDASQVYAGTDRGIVKVITQNDRITAEAYHDNMYLNVSVTSLLYRNNEIYVGTTKGLYKHNLSNNSWCLYRASKGKEENRWLMNATYLNFIDDQLWVGNEFGVASIKSSDPFTPFLQDFVSEKKINHVFTFYVDNKKMLHIATSNGYYRLNTNDLVLENVGKPSYIISCFPGIKNETILSGFDGTQFVEGKELKPLSSRYPELKELDSEPVISPVVYKGYLYFFASFYGNGIYVYDAKQKKMSLLNLISAPLKLKQTTINNLFLDNGRYLWILNDNLIEVLDIPSWTIKSFEIQSPYSKEPLNLIKDVCRINNNYYLAVYGYGIVELDSGMNVVKIVSKKQHIDNINLYKIFPMGDSAVLTTSNNGMYIYNIKNDAVKSYFEADGLNSNAFEQFSGYLYEGKYIIGGINGLTIVDPNKIVRNPKAPQFYFNHITIETQTKKIDSTDIELNKITIPNNVLQTTVFLSAINWDSPDRVNFSWRIGTSSNKWTDIGIQNTISLIGLPPGTYHLQVKAANEEGVWSEPKELVLIFLPKWYQTWWFKVLVVLTTAGIVYAFYRYRINQIKKQHEIRKNIATDLHDDLGSTLNSVKVFTNLAISGVNQNESLQQVKDNLTEATMSLRDMIWVLDDSLDTVDELVTRLKQFALPITAASNMEFVINAGSDVNARTLTKEEKRNLFLICKEAINNSIKYSGASKITVDIIPSGKKIQITVADNGKGFDEATVKKGYGLKNMQYRAGQVRYKAIITPDTVNGTTITILPE